MSDNNYRKSPGKSGPMPPKERKSVLLKIKKVIKGEPRVEQPHIKNKTVRLFRDPIRIWVPEEIKDGTYIAVKDVEKLEHEIVSQLGCLPWDADIYLMAATVRKTIQKMTEQEVKE